MTYMRKSLWFINLDAYIRRHDGFNSYNEINDSLLMINNGNHKLFSYIVSTFGANEETPSIKATEKNVFVQNYAEGTHVDNRFVRLRITLNWGYFPRPPNKTGQKCSHILIFLHIFFFFKRPKEFEGSTIGESTTITFYMRELRAILNFAEKMNASNSANFDTTGK